MMTLCAATEMEIASSIELIRQQHLPVEVLITGVGLLSATYSITEHLLLKKPGLIIQAGIAGTLEATLEKGITVAVASECIGDSGVTENGNFLSLFDLGLMLDEAPWQTGKLYNNNSGILNLCALPTVHGVTVSEITTSEKKIGYYRESLGAEIETLEGAALHFAAARLGIPYLQVRTISNLVGERDKTKWDLTGAIQNLNLALSRIINTCTNR